MRGGGEGGGYIYNYKEEENCPKIMVIISAELKIL